jgi:hypothetical protein
LQSAIGTDSSPDEPVSVSVCLWLFPLFLKSFIKQRQNVLGMYGMFAYFKFKKDHSVYVWNHIENKNLVCFFPTASYKLKVNW